MGGHFKADCDFTSQCLVLSLSLACQVSNLGLSGYSAIGFTPHPLLWTFVFSETTCNFEGLFVVVGFYSFSWIFDFSVSSERECVGERLLLIQRVSAFLCI